MIDPRRMLVDVAHRFVGIQEQGGDNKGPEVERFQRAVDGKAAGEPWCMAFVQFCVAEVEARTGVKSNLFRSEHCMTVWNKSPQLMRRKRPEPGLIVIWSRVNTAFGHTGIVTRQKSPEVYETIEGNTSKGFGIEREGDGVFVKLRTINGTQLFRPVGYLQPF